ncbi:uncharacterized protein LOC130990682 [Salvia miltiorrhiza]|uniref:uncharacterized protein LOC130990682 n=1 Tax=Salvia miltiorrhiza TaxID=226208 RepID=UPI0025ACD5B7|nr:uncharacterized protein LOC130990682 [Salvia miltiorrhiza]
MAIERPKLKDDDRNKLAQWLLEHSTAGKLHYGAKKDAALHFKVNLKTIWRIWSQVSNQRECGVPVQVKSIRKGCLHKDKMNIDVEKVKKLSVLERSSLRCMSTNLGVSKSLIHKLVKEKKLKPHTNAIKPFLTTQNRLSRLSWSLKQLSSVSESGFIPFQSMYNTIHIDEKWFYLTKTKDRYYLMPDEVEPYRTCKSKRYIPKIMFMCAVARPIIDSDGTVLFDGKFGIFPFTTNEAAQRNSKNRCKGTMEVRPIPAITKDIIKACLINEIIPAIKAKWPQFASKHIFIQQDNAKPHIKPNDPDFLAVANTDGFNIQLVCQSANSPDTNVNDLGFFRAIQTLKYQKPATDVEELLKNVNDAYVEYPPEKINNVFLTLQGCYHEIIKAKGGNNYKIPHINKERQSGLGILPEVIKVPEDLVRESLQELQLAGSEGDAIYNLDDVIEGLQQRFMLLARLLTVCQEKFNRLLIFWRHSAIENRIALVILLAFGMSRPVLRNCMASHLANLRL